MKIAAIIGGAASVWEDLQRLQALSEIDEVFAVNHVGMKYSGKIDHWVTIHSEFMQDWLEVRAARHFNTPRCIWFSSEGNHPNIPHQTSEEWGGSSGLLAAKIALELGFERIVLCGIPVEASAKHFLYEQEWDGAQRYQRAWELHAAELTGKVRSMSGWTARLLGQPDEFWL